MNYYIDRDELLKNIGALTAFSKEDGSGYYKAQSIEQAIADTTTYSPEDIMKRNNYAQWCATERLRESAYDWEKLCHENQRKVENLKLENDALKKELDKYKHKPNPHWEEKEYGVARCSECGWVRVDLRGHTFCPNCGVRMVCE